MRRFVSYAALAAFAGAVCLWIIPNPWTDVLPDGLPARLGRVLAVTSTVAALLVSLLQLWQARHRPAGDGDGERPAWWRSPRTRAGVAFAGLAVFGLTIVAQPLLREPATVGTTQAAGPPSADARASATSGPGVTPGPSGVPVSSAAPGVRPTPLPSAVPATPPSSAPAAPVPAPSTPAPARAAGPKPVVIDVTSAKYIDVDGQQVVASENQTPGDNNDVMIEAGQITSKGNTELAEATSTWQCGPLTDTQQARPYPPGRWCGRTARQQRPFLLEVTEAPGVNKRTVTVTYPTPA